MVKYAEKDLLNNLTFSINPKINITTKEHEAIVELSTNPKLVIKNADKSGKIVIENRSQYLKECYRQLSNQDFYEKLDYKPTDQYRKDIQNNLDLYQNGQTDESVKDYLTDTHCKTPNFYTLAKIHKGIKPFVRGRPILLANQSACEKISKCVDHSINPLCPKVRSYVMTGHTSYKYWII